MIASVVVSKWMYFVACYNEISLSRPNVFFLLRFNRFSAAILDDMASKKKQKGKSLKKDCRSLSPVFVEDIIEGFAFAAFNTERDLFVSKRFPPYRPVLYD